MAILGTTEKETRKLEAHSEALIAYLAAPGTDVDRARLAATAIDGLRQLVEDLIDRADPLALSLFELTQSDSTISKDDVAAAYAQILTGSMEPLSVALTACVVRAAESGPIGEANVAEFIEETLTRIPPFHFAPRVAASDLVLEGKHINRGERVVLNLLSANDDGCPFVGSEEHLSFGAGTHYCLGAAAARAHLRAVLPPLLEAGVQQRVELAGVRRRSAFGASSFEAVPLRSVESPQQ
jgi:cytochrome P450